MVVEGGMWWAGRVRSREWNAVLSKECSVKKAGMAAGVP